jgi:hypothetical protein
VKTKLLICLIALLTTGCTLFDRQEKRINYTKMLDWGGQSLVTDAKQRAIINTKAEVGIGDTRYGGEDTTDDQVVKNHPHRIICAEPSPDVAQAISAAFTAAGQVDANVPQTGQFGGSGSIGSSYAESIAQLGERLATVQLLRDKMYRACEAYQNGAISDTSYTLMLARFDKTMASMLASEIAAGAFGRNLATLGGSASTGGVDPKKLADAQKEVTERSSDVRTLANSSATTADQKAQIAAANEKLSNAVTNLVTLEFQSAVGAAQSGPSGGGGVPGQIEGTRNASSDVVARIHANFLDDDASGTLIDACVVALDRNRAGAPPDAQAAKLISDARNEVITNKATVDAAEQASKKAAEQVKSAQAAERADTSDVRRAQEDKTTKEKDASNARERLADAERRLGYLENLFTKPSLGNLCAAMLKNGPQDQNFLLQLQDHKLKARTAESSVALKQILLRGCAESTKDITDKIARADKYATCISKASQLSR